MTSDLLAPFLRPRKVALVGASRDPSSITARPVRYLRDHGFAGEVVVVNPSAVPELGGYTAVGSVDEVAGADVAMVLVPADRVVPTLEQCATAGIERAVVIASGFEGDGGAERRGALQALLRAHPGLRILGPNCNGSMSITGRAPLTFSSVLQTARPRPGRVALVMQSGAIGNAILLALVRRGAGLSHLFSTGNELSVGAVELAAALLDESDTDVVALFLEGITDPHNLDHLGDAIERTGKQVVAFRTSASAGARAAAFGHTGRILGDDELARSALRAAGVRLVESVEELCDVVTVLSVVPPPRRSPSRVGVVTVSGGAGVIAAEAIGRSSNLTLEPFSGPGVDGLAEVLPTGTDLANPLDVPTLGAPEVFPRVLGAAVGAGVDAVVAVATTLAHDYELLSRLEVAGDRPVVITHLSPEERFTPEQAAALAERGIATVPNARGAVAALDVWAAVAPRVDVDADAEAPGARAASTHADPTGHDAPDGSLGLVRGTALLGDAVARHVATAAVAHDARAAATLASDVGFPVVLKAEGTAVPHRTDRGAVAVGLRSAAEVEEAFARVAQASAPDPVVVQAMAPAGIEVLVSVVRDPEVGIAVVLRPGGVLVELGTGSVVLTGRRDRWAAELEGTALGRLLAGWRGAVGGDADALLGLAGDLADAAAADSSVAAIECNPVLVHPPGSGATVVDVLVQEKRGT